MGANGASFFFFLNHWLPVTAVRKSSSGIRVTSDPTYDKMTKDVGVA